MKKSTLPKFIHPLEFAQRNTEIEGTLKLQELKRLQEVLAEKKEDIAVKLQFGKDIEGFCYITGNIQTILWLKCQRCLKPIAFPMNINVSLSPVFNEKSAKKLPERYEPLIITEEPLLLADIIEEELLLALPMATKHEQDNCAGTTTSVAQKE